MLVLIAYLAVAITAFNRKPADQTCRDMELVIKDTAYAGFITKEELKGILQQKGLRLYSVPISYRLSEQDYLNNKEEDDVFVGDLFSQFLSYLQKVCGRAALLSNPHIRRIRE